MSQCYEFDMSTQPVSGFGQHQIPVAKATGVITTDIVAIVI